MERDLDVGGTRSVRERRLASFRLHNGVIITASTGKSKVKVFGC